MPIQFKDKSKMGDVTNHKIICQSCRSSDIQSVMDINESTLPENYPLFFYEQILERYPDSFLIVSLKDDPSIRIGYIMWRIERGPSSFGLDYVKKGHLVSLAVLPRYRRLGAASLLLKESMKIIQKYNVSEYVLEVRVSNTGAVRLYEEVLNFEKIRIIGHYYRDGEDAFYLSHKYEPFNQYAPHSIGMLDDEVFQYYYKHNQGHLCYRCPNCEHVLVKGLSYSYPGSIHPNDPSIIKCAYCNNNVSKFSISQGQFDMRILKQ
ncbi:MAG: GNAT family N-acetyltransferase [Promethearchaeota archaeon]